MKGGPGLRVEPPCAILSVPILTLELRNVAKSPGSFTSKTAKAAAAKSPMHKPGWRTKVNVLRDNAALIAAKNQMTPLEVLSGFANDEESDTQLRVTAAAAAARYVHRPMPQAVELSGTITLRRTFAAAVQGDEPEEGTPP